MPTSTLSVFAAATRLRWVLVPLLILSCTTPQKEARTEGPGLRGRAVKIVDGDTFDLLLPEERTVRIRLHGVDCPERGQDYGKAAKEALGEMMQGQSLRVVAVDSDRYGRSVGEVYTDAGLWVNHELVKRGLAWHYTAYSADERLAAAEREARTARTGLWSMPKPVAPWEWRKEKRSGGKKKKVSSEL